MSRLRPISKSRFIKFLRKHGCHFAGYGRGSHMKWKKAGLNRPLIIPDVSEICVTHIHTNLKTLGITHAQFLKEIERL